MNVRIKVITVAAGLGVLAAVLAVQAVSAEDKEKRLEKSVFELRTYHVHEGKMAALQARFRDHTNKLLAKHGMSLIGFWTPTDPKDADTTLIYLVAHPSEEQARKNWQTFREDPDWKAAKEASEKDGPLVKRVDSVYLKPTDFSALK